MAGELRFNVVFTGDLAEGFDVSDVKKKAGQLFKMDAEKVGNLFKGKPITLKKNLDESGAQKYQKILSQIGMVVLLESQHATAEKPVDNRAASQNQPSQESDNTISVPEWQLDEVGVLLSKPSQQTTTPVQAPSYTLAAQPCNILTAEEMPKPLPSLNLPTLDEIDISDVGAPLVDESEKTVTPVPTINVSHLSAEAVGMELLRQSERAPVKEIVIDTSRIDLIED